MLTGVDLVKLTTAHSDQFSCSFCAVTLLFVSNAKISTFLFSLFALTACAVRVNKHFVLHVATNTRQTCNLSFVSYG